MLKIMKACWVTNENVLRDELTKMESFNGLDYPELVKLTFKTIYNSFAESITLTKLDLDKMTVIDNGDYQGTILFMIPFETYQPCEGEYILTYIGYGSCCGCDALQAAIDGNVDAKGVVSDLMTICKDLITNAIKPYNSGWRNHKLFDQVDGFEEDK